VVGKLLKSHAHVHAHERNIEADLHSIVVVVGVAGTAVIVFVISGGGCDDDDAPPEELIWLGPDNGDFTPCISVVNDHAVCGFSSKLYND
jgi:hypothetical protein